MVLYNTVVLNYIQYPIINHMEKNMKKMCVYIYICYIYIYIKWNHFAVQQKLTEHCKSTILQFF